MPCWMKPAHDGAEVTVPGRCDSADLRGELVEEVRGCGCGRRVRHNRRRRRRYGRRASRAMQRINVGPQRRQIHLGRLILGGKHSPDFLHRCCAPSRGSRLEGAPGNVPVESVAIGADFQDRVAQGRVRLLPIGDGPRQALAEQLLSVVGEVDPDDDTFERGHRSVDSGRAGVVDGGESFDGTGLVPGEKHVGEDDAHILAMVVRKVLGDELVAGLPRFRLAVTGGL